VYILYIRRVMRIQAIGTISITATTIGTFWEETLLPSRWEEPIKVCVW